MNPVLIGYILSLPRLVDAFTDPIMGYVSDHTISRFGRRKPFIFLGAITLGITFALMWRIGYGHSEMFYFVFFLIGSFAMFIFNTIFAIPFNALGYEMTPDIMKEPRLWHGLTGLDRSHGFYAPGFGGLWQIKHILKPPLTARRASRCGSV